LRPQTAYTEELPGAISEGDTLDEARDNRRGAIKILVEANRDLARKPGAGQNVVRQPITVSAS
jgi:predicted RNase H-like HicB family nuclease